MIAIKKYSHFFSKFFYAYFITLNYFSYIISYKIKLIEDFEF